MKDISIWNNLIKSVSRGQSSYESIRRLRQLVSVIPSETLTHNVPLDFTISLRNHALNATDPRGSQEAFLLIFQLVTIGVKILKPSLPLITDNLMSLFRKNAKPSSVSYCKKLLSLVNNNCHQYSSPFLHNFCVNALLFCPQDNDLEKTLYQLLIKLTTLNFEAVLQDFGTCLIKISKNKAKISNSNFENVSTASMILTIIVQHGLLIDQRETKIIVLTFIENLLTVLIKGSLQTLSLKFLELLFNDLYELSNGCKWPGAKFVLNLFNKKLCLSLINYSNQEVKLKQLAIRGITKIAIQLKKGEECYQNIIEKLNVEENQLINMVSFYFKLRSDCSVGLSHNVGKIYEIMWQVFFQNVSEMNVKISNSEADQLASYFDAKFTKRDSFCWYAELFAKITRKNIGAIKASALKSLHILIDKVPSLISKKSIENTLNNEKSKEISSRISIANIFQSCLSIYPENLPTFLTQIFKFLSDQHACVRKAMLSAVRPILQSRKKCIGKTDLIVKTMSLITDTNEELREIIRELFKMLWLESGEQIDVLIEACKSPLMVESFIKIMSECVITQKSICLSQGLTQMDLMKESTRRLVEFVWNYIESNAGAIYSEEVASILKAIAINSPPSIMPYYAKLEEAVFCISNDDCKKSLIDVILAITPYLDDENKKSLKNKIVNEINNFSTSKKLVHNLLAMLKLLRNVSIFDENKDFISENLEILKDNRTTIGRGLENVKRAICAVIMLKQDYADNPQIKGLINNYFRSPKYFTTCLSAVCYIRQEYISLKPNEVVEQQVIKYLKLTTEVGIAAEITTAALYYIKSTLLGFKEMGDSVFEVVSILVQKVRNNILECALSQNQEIRRAAFDVIRILFHSGFIPEHKMLPYLCAMTADPLLALRSTARKLLLYTSETRDITEPAKRGLMLAYRLARNQDGDARGLDKDALQATFNFVYEILQKSSSKRSRFLEYVLKYIADTKDENLSIYLIDQLYGFHYKYLEELGSFITLLDKQIIAISAETVCKDDNGKYNNLAKYLQRLEDSILRKYNTSKVIMEKYSERGNIKLQKKEIDDTYLQIFKEKWQTPTTPVILPKPLKTKKRLFDENEPKAKKRKISEIDGQFSAKIPQAKRKPFKTINSKTTEDVEKKKPLEFEITTYHLTKNQGKTRILPPLIELMDDGGSSSNSEGLPNPHLNKDHAFYEQAHKMENFTVQPQSRTGGSGQSRPSLPETSNKTTMSTPKKRKIAKFDVEQAASTLKTPKQKRFECVNAKSRIPKKEVQPKVKKVTIKRNQDHLSNKLEVLKEPSQQEKTSTKNKYNKKTSEENNLIKKLRPPNKKSSKATEKTKKDLKSTQVEKKIKKKKKEIGENMTLKKKRKFKKQLQSKSEEVKLYQTPAMHIPATTLFSDHITRKKVNTVGKITNNSKHNIANKVKDKGPFNSIEVEPVTRITNKKMLRPLFSSKMATIPESLEEDEVITSKEGNLSVYDLIDDDDSPIITFAKTNPRKTFFPQLHIMRCFPKQEKQITML